MTTLIYTSFKKRKPKKPNAKQRELARSEEHTSELQSH